MFPRTWSDISSKTCNGDCMAANEPARIVVCDAGPLIHLDELNCLELLSDYAAVLVPEIIWQEVKRHRPMALRRRGVTLTHVSEIPVADLELKRLRRVHTIHRGEQQALRLMQRHPD